MSEGKTLAIVLGTAGGVGTTFFVETLVALATLSEMSTAVVDADPGCQGYRARNGDMSASVLPWLPVGHADAAIFNGAKWHVATLADAEFQLIDAGANLVRSSSAILEMLNDVISAAFARAAHVVVFIVTELGRPGSAVAVDELRRKLEPVVDIVVVQNDRGDRASYAARPTARLPDEIQIPYWPAGLMAVRLTGRLPIAGILEQRPPTYRHAVGFIAKQLQSVWEQAPITAIFKDRPGEVLARLVGTFHDPEIFDDDALEATCDDAVEVKAAVARAGETFLSVDVTNLQGLLAAAVEFRKRRDVYDQMIMARVLGE